MNGDRNSRIGLGTFIAGSLIGIGAGLLLAPKRGEDMRSDIKDIGQRAKYRFYRTKNAVKHGMADARHESAKRAQQARERLEAKLQDMQPEEYE